MEPQKESVGERLKKLRNGRNLTIPEVSRITGIAKSSLSDLENNKSNPGKINLVRLSEFYGVSTDWILFGDTADKEEGKGDSFSVPVTSLELAVYFSRIAEIWERGDEEMKAWVMVQLRRAFPEVDKKVGKKK